MDNKDIDPDFENQYNQIDAKVKIFAQEILNQVSKYDARVLKKINIRLDRFIQEIKDVD